MALFNYFKKMEDTVSTSACKSGLQDEEEKEVKRQLQLVCGPSQPKKKRQNYGNYDTFLRAEIAKWGIVNGIRPAARKFGVPEFSVRGFIKNYKDAKVGNAKLDELPKKQRGAKPLLPAELDEKVLSMIKSMRQAGCVCQLQHSYCYSKRNCLSK